MMNKSKRSALGTVVAAVLIAVMCFAMCACGHVHTYVNGECADCGAVCEHEKYTDGVCDECGVVCTHKKYTDGVCDECGTVCEHIEYVNGVCKFCKIICEHENFANGACTVCHYVCTHPIYEGSVCVDCGAVCAHTTYNNGVCEECGTVCKHEAYVNGECKECHIKCIHNYVNGVCTICLTACEHALYVNGLCAVCGMPGNNAPSKYDYEPHISEVMPRITVNTADGKNDWANLYQNFDMNDLTSKDNRPYNDCTITVSNCEDDYKLNDIEAQVKIRGNYTANYAKKPFRIKFGKKQSMLGLNGGNKFKSWVLLAEWKDNSHLRNSVAFYLGNQILGSDGYYCTDFRLVELYLNKAYWGVYLLAEQQQVDENRVNVTEPEKNYLGTDIGYFIEYDGYYNFETYSERFSCQYNNNASLKTRNGNTTWVDKNVGFAIKNDVYYEGDEQSCAQKQFIKNYINNLYKLCYEAAYNHKYYQFNEDYSALVSYTPTAKTVSGKVLETVVKVVDVESLVDTYIVNEIMCDYDLAWSSFCMDVDFGAGSDKLLRFEAPWDFDSALGLRLNENNAQNLYAANKNNPWILLFINQDWFWNAVCEKWDEIRDAGVAEKTTAFIDAMEKTYKSYFQENDDRWGFQVNGELCPEAMQASNITETIAYLRNWVSNRFAALDKHFGYKG